MSDNNVYIVSGCRTPIGTFLGSFNKTPAHVLGSIVIKEALKRANVDASSVSEVIMGQTLVAGQGQNPARQASTLAGIPFSVPAYGINMLCGSGLKSISLAFNALRTGDADIIVAGGQENMSLAPHVTDIRQGCKLGTPIVKDSLMFDGLRDPAVQMSMGDTAEILAHKYEVSRIAQDEFAYNSQMKTAHAKEKGYFTAEIVPVVITKAGQPTTISEDEFPKSNTTLEGLAKLKPVFKSKQEGSVTPGNSSGINDGAAVLVLVSEKALNKLKCKPLVKIVGFAQCGIDPEEMGLGPITAVKNLLSKINWTVDDVDLFELNEAFAVQSIICQKKLNIPDSKLNVSGGAISLGHPIGCSGTRVLITLIYNMQRLDKKRGVASLCIGGGMGIAVAIERV